jgi:putative salt-induced outer membrane protein
MRRASGALAVVFLGLATVAAAADAPAPPAPPPPLWAGQAEVSFVSTTGNTDVQTFGAAGQLTYHPAPWTFDAKAAFLRGETDGEVKARSFSALLRGGRNLTPRLEAYVQGDYLKNTFAGIDQRISGEGGLAYALLPGPAHTLKAQAGLGYVNEKRIVGDDRSFAAAKGGLLYKWKFSKTGELSDELTGTADLKDSKDWRATNTFAVAAALSTKLSLKLSHALAYLNEPVPGFHKTDTITSFALVAKF